MFLNTINELYTLWVKNRRQTLIHVTVMVIIFDCRHLKAIRLFFFDFPKAITSTYTAFIYPYLLDLATFFLRLVIQFPLGSFLNSFIHLCFGLPSSPLRFQFTTTFIMHPISIRDQPMQFSYTAVLLLYQALCKVVLNPYYFCLSLHDSQLVFSTLLKIFFSRTATFSSFSSVVGRVCRENWSNDHII